MADVVTAYPRPSLLAGDELALAGSDADVFFAGWLPRPRLVARLLLAVAAVARASYFRPITAKSLDPVLTTGDGWLRIESFSSCCGVYARADVRTDGAGQPGTTHVDLNQEVRDALSRVDDQSELRLRIGDGGLAVTTRDATVFERRVRLSERWVKGLGEAALAQVGMVAGPTLDAANARRLLQELPAAGRATEPAYTLAPQHRGLRFQQAAVAGAPVVAGPHRLRELLPLAADASGLTVWARPGSGARPAAFQLDLPDARLWLVLSPDVARGFSGEGAGLAAMGDETVVRDATALRPLLGWSSRLDEVSLAERSGHRLDTVRSLLAVLGGQGLVGRDLVAGAWFRRDLPFAIERISRLQPRLRRAARIPAADLTIRPVEGGHEVFVRSGQIAHRVLLTAEGERCTCRWSVRHGSSRGPCRHILAARAHRARA